MIRKISVSFLVTSLFFALTTYANTNTDKSTTAKHYFYQTITKEVNTNSDLTINRWSVIKANNFIQINERDLSKIWIKEGHNITFFTVFNDEKIAIEYNRQDLQMLNKEASWQEIGALLPIQLYSDLIHPTNKVTTSEFLSFPSSVYQYNDEVKEVTLTWLDGEQLPANISIHNLATNQSLETTLSDIKSVEIKTIDKWLDDNKISVYDYADIGDNETNTALQKLISTVGIKTHSH